MYFWKQPICINWSASTFTGNEVSTHLRLYNLWAMFTFSRSERNIFSVKRIVFYSVIYFAWFTRTIVWFSPIHHSNVVSFWICKYCGSTIGHCFYFLHICFNELLISDTFPFSSNQVVHPSFDLWVPQSFTITVIVLLSGNFLQYQQNIFVNRSIWNFLKIETTHSH